MTHPRISKSAFAAAVLVAASSIFAAQASAAQFRAERQTPPPPTTFGFAANSGGSGTTAIVETCNNAASCNLMISYCISHGGDWNETGHNGRGQPTSGSCTYPD
jgi:hypothetical protein